MRKPAFCICENKDADQLRSNREADQRLCFRHTDSTIPLLPKSEIQASNHLVWLYSLVCVEPGRKPEDRFSHNEAHVMFVTSDLLLEPVISLICKTTTLKTNRSRGLKILDILTYHLLPMLTRALVDPVKILFCCKIC